MRLKNLNFEREGTMPDITLEQVGQAVAELRKEVEKKGVDASKVEKIQAFLDSAEEKNQALTRATALAEGHASEIKELKASLEAKGVEHGKMREQVDALELHLARVRGAVPGAAAEYKGSPEYKALNAFCARGASGLYNGEIEVKALRTDSSVDGGFLVPKEMDTEITRKITEIDPIRSVARVRSIGAKSLEVPIRNTIPVATYEGEGDAGADSQSGYSAETLTPFRQTFTTPVTQDLLLNAAFDMEAEMAQDTSEAFAYGEGSGFVVGTGFKQPAGFASNAVLQAAARNSGLAAAITPNSVILLTGDLKVGYQPVYVLNRRTLAVLRTFRADAVAAADGAGLFLWQPGMNGPVSNTINGFPYILADSMPNIAANAYVIAFGDFRRGYTIVDRTGMSVIRDEVSQKRKAIVEFTWHRWNTGQVVLTEAIKLLKCSV